MTVPAYEKRKTPTLFRQLRPSESQKIIARNFPKLAALRTINLAINVDQKHPTKHSIETRFYDASTKMKGLDLIWQLVPRNRLSSCRVVSVLDEPNGSKKN